MNYSAVLATFSFRIVPVPKLRHRSRKGGWSYTPTKLVKFETEIGKMTAAQYSGPKLETERLAAKITVYVWNKSGDVDNFGKSVLDGMQLAGIFKNDSQFDSVVFKRKFVPAGQEGIVVTLYEVEGSGYEKKDAVSPFQ